MPRQSKITNETIQKASKFCATNGFMLQNNHQARKITLKNIKHSSTNINYNLTCKFKNFFTFILFTTLPHVLHWQTILALIKEMNLFPAANTAISTN